MALAVRTNGSLGANIITAAWFNDIRDLLTGTMQDQEVSIKNNLVLQAIGAAPTTAMTAALAASTAMGIGAYVYVQTYVSPDGESTASPTTSITTTSGNQGVNLSAITVGPTGTTARKLYRTVVGGGTVYKLLTTIADNTTTTYNDRTADASLGTTLAPTVPSFGGALVIKNSAGVVTFKINNDGSFSAGGSTGFGNTTIGGTLTVTGQSNLQAIMTATGQLGYVAVGDMIGITTAGSRQDIHIKAPGPTSASSAGWLEIQSTQIASWDLQGVHLKNTSSFYFISGRVARFDKSNNTAPAGTYPTTFTLTHGLGYTPDYAWVGPGSLATSSFGSCTTGTWNASGTTISITMGAQMAYQLFALKLDF